MNSANERVWDLLQTIDLENLDITTFQGVAAPIFAQKENKEALEALALIAFARMARQGEFNGWLNAGGGGAFAKLYNPKGVTPTSFGSDPLMQYFGPDATMGSVTSTSTSTYRTYYYLIPFYAHGDGKITTLHYRVNSAHTGDGTALDTVIYSSDDNGQPLTKIGTASLDLTSSGNDKQSSITETSTDSMTLTQGELYWIGYKENGTTGNATIYAGQAGRYSLLGVHDSGGGLVALYNCYASSTAPNTWSNATDLVTVALKSPIMLGGVIT